MDGYIQLKKGSLLRFGIKTPEGIDTGNFLEFDMEDIELPLKLNECNETHKKNVNWLKRQFNEISKISERKGNQILSLKNEKKTRALKEFYDKEVEAMDLFLGAGGTKKLLNGRNPYLYMFDDIMEYLKPILAKLKASTDDIEKRIKEKYGKQEGDILD